MISTKRRFDLAGFGSRYGWRQLAAEGGYVCRRSADDDSAPADMRCSAENVRSLDFDVDGQFWPAGKVLFSRAGHRGRVDQV
jgi:hypothetical protein